MTNSSSRTAINLILHGVEKVDLLFEAMEKLHQENLRIRMTQSYFLVELMKKYVAGELGK